MLSERRTQLGMDGAEVHTVEHVLAAVAGLEIDDIRIDLDAAEHGRGFPLHAVRAGEDGLCQLTGRLALAGDRNQSNFAGNLDGVDIRQAGAAFGSPLVKGVEYTNIVTRYDQLAVPYTSGLYPGMRIGQISFAQMTTPAERPYGPERGSKYSGQQLPTASRLYLDFKQ